MVEHHPVHNSEVYLLGLPQRPSVPPPSPPSPLTPGEAEPSIPITELCLDDAATTPLALDYDSGSDFTVGRSSVAKQRLSTAIHVLNTEATALRSLVRLYETDRVARAGFDAAVEIIARHDRADRGGKLVFVGVGKSGHIAKKLVATFNSLGVRATYLHPTEALHGDLGLVSAHDVVLFVTFSGRTPELLALLPHVASSLPTAVLTSHRRPDDCELVRRRPGMILLPAPIHESEVVSFGVAAPTTSTTAALALGDALALAASQELHRSVASVFAQNHPGGAIGDAFRKPQHIGEIAVPLCDIPLCRLSKSPAAEHRDDAMGSLPATTATVITGADVLKAGYDSESRWVCLGVGGLASPSRIRDLEPWQLTRDARDIPDLVVRQDAWIAVRAETRIEQAAEWVREGTVRAPSGDGNDGEAPCNARSVLAVVEDGVVVGVLEAGQLLEWVTETR